MDLFLPVLLPVRTMVSTVMAAQPIMTDHASKDINQLCRGQWQKFGMYTGCIDQLKPSSAFHLRMLFEPSNRIGWKARPQLE